jgi:hypothetical protein
LIDGGRNFCLFCEFPNHLKLSIVSVDFTVY